MSTNDKIPQARVILRDLISGVEAPADLLPATPEVLCLAKASWSDGFQLRRRDGNRDQDALWWDVSVQPNGHHLQDGVCGHVLLRGGSVEGVLLLQSAPKPSRSLPKRLIRYVPYMATAPWNRRGSSSSPRFAGVGAAFMDIVTRTSLATGCGGWIGLHSLREAESYYAGRGLTDHGVDPMHHGLHYFEGVAYPPSAHQMILGWPPAI